MNKHILFVMRNLDNSELFTQEEKEVNRKSAYAAYAAYTAAYAAADTAADDAFTEWWVNEFFERSGEDKQTYIDEVERLRGNKIMNKHILFVMRNLDNSELFTQEEKEVNRKSAYAGAAGAAAASAAAYTADADDAFTEYWVKKFFKRAGEDKQTYIDEVERLKGE